VKLGTLRSTASRSRRTRSKHKGHEATRACGSGSGASAEVDRWLQAAEAAMRRRTKLHGARAWRRDCPLGWPTKRSGLPRSARPSGTGGGAKAAAEEEMRARRRRKRSACAGTQKERQDAGTAESRARRQDATQLQPIRKAASEDQDGYIQGYNAQAAVDAQAKIIVAHGLTQSMSDHDQLVPAHR